MAQQSLGRIFINGLFSLQGRMGRGGFWICTFALGMAAALLGIGLTSLLREMTANAWPIWVLPLAFQLLIVWPTFAITVKRGHDRERSALWTLGVNIAGHLIPNLLLTTGRMEGAFWVWAVIGIYILVDYGLLPGTQGSNRYGPPPA